MATEASSILPKSVPSDVRHDKVTRPGRCPAATRRQDAYPRVALVPERRLEYRGDGRVGFGQSAYTQGKKQRDSSKRKGAFVKRRKWLEG